MCLESSALPKGKIVTAVAHQTYVLRDVGDAPSRPGKKKTVAALVAPDTPISERDGLPVCVACVTTRTVVRVTGSPLLRKTHGLPAAFDAVLLPSDDEPMRIVLSDGTHIDLADFLHKDVRIRPVRELTVGESLTEAITTLACAA